MSPRWMGFVLCTLSTLSSVSAQAADIRVVIDKLVFEPVTVKAKVGDTIEWVNKDVFAHTATVKNGGFDVMIGAKKSARMVVKTAGEFDYYCKFHPNMTGHLTVAE
jgi:plastocyanin